VCVQVRLRIAVVDTIRHPARNSLKESLQQHLKFANRESSSVVEIRSSIVKQQRGQLGLVPTAGQFANRLIDHCIPGTGISRPPRRSANRVGHCRASGIAHCLPGRNAILLLQVAEFQISATGNFALIKLFFTQKYAAKRRFVRIRCGRSGRFLIVRSAQLAPSSSAWSPWRL